jgi:hypothetical protein
MKTRTPEIGNAQHGKRRTFLVQTIKSNPLGKRLLIGRWHSERAFHLDRDLQSTPRVPRQSHRRPDQAPDHRTGRAVRPPSAPQAECGPGGQRAQARHSEDGAADLAPKRPVMRAVTEAVYEAWQARENCIHHVAAVQIPCHRIGCSALEFFAQVRPLLGVRAVAKPAREPAKFSAATATFGDAQLLPPDRVWRPAVGRARPVRRARLSHHLSSS